MTEQQQAQEPTELIHHTSQKMQHGCLPLYMLVIAAPLFACMIFVQIKMPTAPIEAGEGTIYQKNSAFMYSKTRRLSPLQLQLPSFADPLQQEAFVPELKIGRDPQLDNAPSLSPLNKKRRSSILNKEELLALPPLPEKGAPQHATP